MKIVDTTGAALAVFLTPDDCLLLADACRMAADETQEDGPSARADRATSTHFFTAACLLEGYALVGQAIASLAPAEREGFDLAVIRREWGVLPTDWRAS